MPGIKIAHLNYYVPGNCLPVQDLLDRIEEKDIPTSFAGKQAYADFIRDELNIEAIRVEDKLSDQEMLTNTVEQIFIDGAAEPGEIDLIILAQEEDQRQKLNLGQYIQYEFGMDNAYVLSLSGNHCANIDHALALSTQISKANENIRNILILGNVKVSNIKDRLVGTYGVLSDGSGTMLLRKDGKGPGLVDSCALSAGRFHDTNLNRDDSLILMKYYVKSIREVLAKSGIAAADITHIITQNANPVLTNQCLEMAGLDVEKIFMENQITYSHLDCLDFLVNLKDLVASIESSKEKGLILSFGTGWAGSFISSILSYGD